PSPPDVSIETREEPLALEQQRRDTRLVLAALPLELGRTLLARRQPRAAFLEQALELRTAGAGSVELLLDRGAGRLQPGNLLPERRLPGVHVLLEPPVQGEHHGRPRETRRRRHDDPHGRMRRVAGLERLALVSELSVERDEIVLPAAVVRRLAQLVLGARLPVEE